MIELIWSYLPSSLQILPHLTFDFTRLSSRAYSRSFFITLAAIITQEQLYYKPTAGQTSPDLFSLTFFNCLINISRA